MNHDGKSKNGFGLAVCVPRLVSQGRETSKIEKFQTTQKALRVRGIKSKQTAFL